MKKMILIVGWTLALFSISLAQTEAKKEGKVILEKGTEFLVGLQTGVDTNKAKVADVVHLKITKDVQGVLDKDSEIFARVVRVQNMETGQDASKIGLLFDFIKKDNKFLPLDVIIVGIDKDTSGIEFTQSPTYKSGTLLTLKGKDIHLDEGTVFRIKLEDDLRTKEK